MDLSEKLGWMAHQHKISTTIFFGWVGAKTGLIYLKETPLAFLTKFLVVFLILVRPRFSRESMVKLRQLFTITIYFSLIGKYCLLTGSLGMYHLSSNSTSYSSSFSITKPRYLTCLLMRSSAAFAWLFRGDNRTLLSGSSSLSSSFRTSAGIICSTLWD